MIRQSLTLILVGFGCLPAVVHAQVIPSVSTYPQPQPGYGFGVPWLGGYSSTPGEGWLRGEADWMRGYGDSARSQAQAAYIDEMTTEKYLQNRQQQTAARDARRAAAAQVSQDEAARRRRDTMARRYEAYLSAQTLLPEIEATGGELDWPSALDRPEFEADLRTISSCLGRWIQQDHTLSRTDRGELKRSLEPLETHLRRQRLQSGSNTELAAARDLLQKIDTLVFSSRPPLEKLAAN